MASLKLLLSKRTSLGQHHSGTKVVCHSTSTIHPKLRHTPNFMVVKTSRVLGQAHGKVARRDNSAATKIRRPAGVRCNSDDHNKDRISVSPEPTLSTTIICVKWHRITILRVGHPCRIKKPLPHNCCRPLSVTYRVEVRVVFQCKSTQECKP